MMNLKTKNNNKRVAIQIDSCQNCFFCDQDAKNPKCIYATVMVEGLAIPIKDVKKIPKECPLEDVTPKDCVPAPVLFTIDETGCSVIIDN